MFLDDIIKEIEDECSKPGSHSDIGASKAEEWFNCPASVMLGKGMPDSKHPAATEGTFYHKLGELMLHLKISDIDAQGFIGERVSLLGHSFVISEQMIDGVILYCSTVRKKHLEKTCASLSIEMKFCINSVDDQAFGTADAVINEPYVSLEIIDLKTGRRLVSPESKQLKFYALGALEACDTDFSEVRLTIVQPQEYEEENKVKTFTLSRKELMDFKEELKAAIKKVRNATIKDVKEGKWCFFCKGKAKCPPQQDKALAVAKNGFDEVKVIEDCPSLSEDKLKWCLENDSKIRDFLNTVKSYATSQAKVGKVIPGHKLVKVRTNRAWIPGAEEHLESELGEAAYKITKKLCSPSQAETALRIGLGVKESKATEILKPYFFNPDKGVVLVEESDKRPAVNFFEPVISTELL